jgi:hypothetical protein
MAAAALRGEIMSEDVKPPLHHKPSPGLIRAEVCGNCLFGVAIPEDLSLVTCHGVPPTPAIFGMTPNGPSILMMRARLPRSEAGCALHRGKLVLAS